MTVALQQPLELFSIHRNMRKTCVVETLPPAKGSQEGWNPKSREVKKGKKGKKQKSKKVNRSKAEK